MCQRSTTSSPWNEATSPAWTLVNATTTSLPPPPRSSNGVWVGRLSFAGSRSLRGATVAGCRGRSTLVLLARPSWVGEWSRLEGAHGRSQRQERRRRNGRAAEHSEGLATQNSASVQNNRAKEARTPSVHSLCSAAFAKGKAAASRQPRQNIKSSQASGLLALKSQDRPPSHDCVRAGHRRSFR